MDILYLLVPLSVIAMLAVLGVFAWALRGGQLDNLTGEGERILWTDSTSGCEAPSGAAKRSTTARDPTENRP